jgi:dTDP-4-amino-4,6-dideoxygalactose transaminase
MTIPFVDLKVRDPKLRSELATALAKAIDDAQFVLGTQVADFENAFAEYSGADHCVGVANGTEALHLALLALGIGRGDEVITAANTYIATALAIAYTGASPVLVDVDPDTYLIDPALVERAITPKTKVIIPVHLYGQPANMKALSEIAERHGLAVVQDACQAHGALIGNALLASFGDAACYSFYPSKNLGAFGDGGAVVTGSAKLAERIRTLRNLGQRAKNDFVTLGFNSRLDTLQAAILSVKLRYLDHTNERRRAAAATYGRLLRDTDLVLPAEQPGVSHIYHLYVVQHPERDTLATHLHRAGVQCGIHYPTPIHKIPVFHGARSVPDGAPVSCRLAERILSLPMFPELTTEAIARVADAVRSFAPIALAG